MTTSEVDYDSDPDDYITVYTSKWTFSLRLSNTLVSLSQDCQCTTTRAGTSRSAWRGK